MNDDIKRIKIIHISDIHFNVDIYSDPVFDPKFDHRYGSDTSVLSALSEFLLNHEFDFLVISGDLSRKGEKQSYHNVFSWLEADNNFAEGHLCVNLRKRNIPYILVPGNHDRFNGGYVQTALKNYYDFFPLIKINSVSKYDKKGISCYFHLFDSSYEKGGFGNGYLEKNHLHPKGIRHKPNQLHIAVLHHHLFQAPNQDRKRFTELINSKDALLYFLGNRFDSILFGHTHNMYFEHLPAKSIIDMLPTKRKKSYYKSGFFNTLIEKIRDMFGDENSINQFTGNHYPQLKKVKGGQLISLSRIYDYIYLTQLSVFKKGHNYNYNLLKWLLIIDEFHFI